MVERPGQAQGAGPASADFLLLVVDSTRQSSFDELSVVFSLLPVGWWSYTAVVVTKGSFSAPLVLAWRS